MRNALLIVIFLSQLSLVFSQPSDYDLNTNYSINDMVIREQTTYFSLIDNNKGIQPPDVNSWISLEDYFNQLGYEQPLSTWSALTSYNKDDAVSHDGVMYFALVDNINIEPPATNAWTTGSPSGTSNIWEINSTYNVGDIVFHNEVMYVAINQNTGNEPPNISHWSSANDNTTSVSSSKFLGISTRGLVSSSLSMYGGITVLGNTNKKVAFMGKGQTMLAGGVTNYVGDPYIEIYKQTSGIWSLYKTNDNWGDAQGSENLSTVSGSTGITMPAGASEAAIVLDLEPGNYSVIVKSKSGTLQEALVEAYEVASPTDTSRFLGISTRCPVSSTYPAYGGITVLGTTNKKVAFMGKGQTMLAGGVTNYVGDPYIEIYKQTSGVWSLYKTNDNWGDAQGSENLSTVTGSTGITMPVGASEAAIVLDLEPGNYSVILKSKSGSIQEALVEAYEVN